MEQSTPLLLGPVQCINLVSALGALSIGIFVYMKDRSSITNRLFLAIAVSLCLWTATSTLSDVMHLHSSALAWARLALLGPFWFSGLVHIFSYQFPEQRHISLQRIALIMGPSVLIMPLLATRLNVVAVRPAEWGTDFIPGPLYAVGLVYALVNLGFAGYNLRKAYVRTPCPVTRRQLILIRVALFTVVLSMALTNAILPLAFNYTKASAIGPASSFFFVVLVAYAVMRHRLLQAKILASELFCCALLYVTFATLFRAIDTVDLVLRLSAFLATAVFAVLLSSSLNDDLVDVNMKLALSEKVEAARAAVADAERRRNEFMEVASERLQKPANSIRHGLEWLRDGNYGQLPKAAQEKIEQLAEQHHRLCQQIARYVSVPTMGGEQVRCEQEVFAAGPLAKDLMDDMRDDAKQRGVNLAFSVQANLPPVIADREKFMDVVSALLESGMKHSAAGHNIELKMQLSSSGEFVKFTVSDPGADADDIAMAMDDLLHGLECHAEAVRAMGGIMQVEEEAGITVITFTLPAANVSQTA